MIHTALQTLTEELNSYLALKNGMPGDTKCVLTNVATEDGGWAIPNNKLGLSLINIEEETALKEQRPTIVTTEGNVQTLNPQIKINLFVLISANFTSGEKVNVDGVEYLEGLKQLSHVINFFQGKQIFSQANTPNLAALDPTIEVMYVDLFSYSFEQLYNFWTVVGAKYLPSVLYRVRLVKFQDQSVLDQNPATGDLQLNTGNN